MRQNNLMCKIGCRERPSLVKNTPEYTFDDFMMAVVLGAAAFFIWFGAALIHFAK